MTCQDVITRFLMDYLDGALPPDQESDFERHLSQCPSCVNYLNSYRKTVALEREARPLFTEEEAAAAPEELVQAILALRPPTE